MKSILVWTSFLLTTCAAALLEGGNLRQLIQPTAALIVFGPQLVYLLIQLSPQDVMPFVKRVVNDNCQTSDYAVLQRVEMISYSFGGVSMILGIIHVLNNLVEAQWIGAGIAVALTGFLYSLVTPILFHSIPTRNNTGAQVIQFNQDAKKRAAGFVTIGAAVAMAMVPMTIWVLSR